MLNTENILIPRILIGACGSIDIMLLPQYLRAIKAEINCHISVLLTPAASQFIPLHTLSLYVDRVISGIDPCEWANEKPSKIIHDHDMLLIIPATANTLFECAHGGASNRLTTVVLSANFPVVFFPVMGDVMWKRKSVQKNILLLKEEGYEVIDPVRVEHFDNSLNKVVSHPSFPPVNVLIKWIETKLLNGEV